MASQIKLKKSSEPGKVPQTLEYGELALNYADGILYYKTSANQISQLVNVNNVGGGNATSLTDSNFLLESGSNTVISAQPTLTTIDEFSADLWRSCRYQIQITSSYTYYTCNIVLIHDQVQVNILKSQEINTSENNPGEFYAEYVVGTPNLVRLQFIPQHSETEIVFTRTLLSNTGIAAGIPSGDLETQTGSEDLLTLPVVTFDLDSGGPYIQGNLSELTGQDDLNQGNDILDLD